MGNIYARSWDCCSIPSFRLGRCRRRRRRPRRSRSRSWIGIGFLGRRRRSKGSIPSSSSTRLGRRRGCRRAATSTPPGSRRPSLRRFGCAPGGRHRTAGCTATSPTSPTKPRLPSSRRLEPRFNRQSMSMKSFIDQINIDGAYRCGNKCRPVGRGAPPSSWRRRGGARHRRGPGTRSGSAAG